MDGLIVLLVYGVGGVLVVALGLLFYLRSVSSRKRYCCPQCGEQISVELMQAGHCSTCGAPFKGEMTGERR